MEDSKQLIKYFMEKAKPLSLEYVDQERLAFELNLWDYFTEDIANDWLVEEINVLDELAKENLIGNNAAEIYRKIDKNFEEASLYGRLYEEEIWTLKGLKDHIFWQKQRDLARQFIKELTMY